MRPRRRSRALRRDGPLELLRGRFALKQRDGIAQVRQTALFELIRRAIPGVIDLGLRRHDLVQQLALAVVLARFGIRLGHRDRLPKRSAPLRRDDDDAGARRSL
jgi:hypothetical protein